MSAHKMPSLIDFMTTLKPRFRQIAGTQAVKPMLAITEGHDTFLVDSIAKGNKYFSEVWPADKELDEQALVDAFIALVTAAHKFDSKLQKVFDKLVPKKASEMQFWRRYFAHAHSLLYRLAPTSEESEHQIIDKLPAPRAAEARRYAAKEPLRTSGQLSKSEILDILTKLVDKMTSVELIASGNCTL